MDIVLFYAPFSEGSSGSRSFLRQAACLYSGLTDDELGDIQEGRWGKPYFPALPGLHFSVTHSGDWWICGFSSHPLGIDLQIHRSHAQPRHLSERFFHPDEDAWLAQKDYDPFFDLWSAKESWVKYTGTGFFQDPDSFSVVDQSGVFPSHPDGFLKLIPFQPDYSLCLCTLQPCSWSFRPLLQDPL